MFTGFFVIGFFALMIFLIKYHKKFKLKNSEFIQLQQQSAARIDQLNKNHAETLLREREHILKHEEERIYQWIESEKETLNVISGLSMLLDYNEKLGKIESEKILAKIQEAETKILNNIQNLKNNE
jgi:hypothetical protein